MRRGKKQVQANPMLLLAAYRLAITLKRGQQSLFEPNAPITTFRREGIRSDNEKKR